MDIIFWDFLMFYQIFFSPQVKWCVIISNKHGIFELPHEFPKLPDEGEVNPITKALYTNWPVNIRHWSRGSWPQQEFLQGTESNLHAAEPDIN